MRAGAGDTVGFSWGLRRWVVAVAALVLASACSSGPSSTLSDEERTALGEAAASFDAAELVVVDAFAADVVVPRLEDWQEAESLHQEALAQLRDALPEGACRSAVEALGSVEEDQNAIRLRLIDNYRREQFGLVAEDTTAYGRSVVNGALEAEEAVFTACGRSTVDPARTTGDTSAFTAAQNERFDQVLAAYDATGVAFDAVFSVEEFIADLEALQVADSGVAEALDRAVATLGQGPCRTSLEEVQALEQQQAELRAAMIAAGEAGDVVTMIRTLGEYSGVNSTSAPFTSARQAAVDNCGADL